MHRPSDKTRRFKFAAGAGACACVAALVILSLLPKQDLIRTGAPEVIEHFVSYAGATALTAAVWAASAKRAVVFVAGFVLFAAGLEVAQNWTPGRTPDMEAFLAGALGACLGVIAGAILNGAFRARRRSTGSPPTWRR